MNIYNDWRLQTPVSLQCSKCVDEAQLQEWKWCTEVQSAHDQLVISSVNELQKDWMVIPSLNELHQCTGSECFVHPPRPRTHQRVATLFAHVWETIIVAMAWTCFANVQSISICLTNEHSMLFMTWPLLHVGGIAKCKKHNPNTWDLCKVITNIFKQWSNKVNT